MFGKCPKRITVFSSARAACTKSASVPITAINVFVFIVLFSIGGCHHEISEVSIVTPPSLAGIRARFNSFELKHYLDAPDDFIELILAKLRIRFPEIRPGMNIIDHQLEIVAMDVVVETASNGRDAVVTLLPGIEVFPPSRQLKLLRDQVVASRNIESVGRELGELRCYTIGRARMNPFLKKFAD